MPPYIVVRDDAIQSLSQTFPANPVPLSSPYKLPSLLTSFIKTTPKSWLSAFTHLAIQPDKIPL